MLPPPQAAEIEKIANEHNEAGALVAQFTDAAAELAADPDRARVAFCRVARGLLAFQRHHLRREESKFFKYAGEHLAAATWREISVTVKGLEKNLAAVERDGNGGLRIDREGAARARRALELRR